MIDITQDVEDEDLNVQDDDEMQEIHDFDFARCVQLMTIAEKVATVTPRSTSLLGIAQAELEHMNQQAKDIAQRRAERAKEAEQRRYEAEQRKLKAEAEREAEAKAQDDNRPRPKAIPSAPVPGPGEPSPERRL